MTGKSNLAWRSQGNEHTGTAKLPTRSFNVFSDRNPSANNVQTTTDTATRKKLNLSSLTGLLTSNSKSNALIPTAGSAKPGSVDVQVAGKENVSFNVDADGFSKKISKAEQKQQKKEHNRLEALKNGGKSTTKRTGSQLRGRSNATNYKAPYHNQGPTQIIGRRGIRSTHYPDEDLRPRTAMFRVLIADLNVGTIVLHMVAMDVEDNADLNDPHIKEMFGIRYMFKPRFWLIVARTTTTIWEAPIYSFGDKGLENKPPEIHDDFLNLEPLFATNYKPQNPTKPTLKIASVTGNAKIDRETMVVRMAQVRSRRADKKDVQLVGQVTMESRDIAVEYAKAIIGTVPAVPEDKEEE